MSLVHRLPLRPLAGLGLLGLLGLLSLGCQTTAQRTYPMNSEDIDTSVTLPATLVDVWYRPAQQTMFGIPFTNSGTINVTSQMITFSHDGGSFAIPTANITSVAWRKMVGDRDNEWAVIVYLEGGEEQLAGFTAADGYRFDTSNKQLYSVLYLAWKSAGR